MPERICGRGEGFGERLDRCIKAFFFKHFHKGKVHVDVVVKARCMVIVPLDPVVRPFDRYVVIDDAAVTELGRTSVGASYGLACPASLNLVHKLFLGERDLFRSRRYLDLILDAAHGQDSKCQNGDNS